MRYSIGFRLTAWYAAVLGGLLLAFGGFVYFSVSYRLMGEVDRNLKAGVQWAEQVAAEKGNLEALAEELAEHRPALLWVQVVDRSGRVIFASVPPSGSPPHAGGQGGEPGILPPSVLARAGAGDTVWATIRTGPRPPVRWAIAPLRGVGEGRLLVQVGESLQGVQAARRALLLGVAVAIPLALLAAAGGGWLLARRALRPVDVLTRAARHITAEELHHRLPDYPANDELGRLTRTLNEMIARLEDSFDQVRRFTADASHELRTPLTVLRGELEVALRAVRSPEEYQRVLASGMEEVRRMERLVDNLLTLARADAGEAQLKWTEVDMTDLVREVVTQGMVLARAKEVALTLEMADEGLRVRGDADRLRELLLHLLDNAVKYTPSGGRVTVRAEVSSVEVCSVPVRASRPPDGGTTNVTRHSSLVTLSVTDTGPGIAPEHLPRIFDRFYRVDKARSRELGGSGLGLAIGRWIAEAHGGRLEVTSGVGRGSTFTVLLPQH